MPGRTSLRWKAGAGIVRPNPSSGFPDASNTGVPAGITLTPSIGNLSTSSNGQVIDALDIEGTVTVNHTNVTISRCRISNSGFFGIEANNGGVVTITDCTLDGDLSDFTGILALNTTVRRCNIFGYENGMAVDGSTTVEDSFIHDLHSIQPDLHSDCSQFGSGISNVTFQHNTLLANGSPDFQTTSCLIMDDPNQNNFLIDNNVFAAGSFSLYGPGTGSTNCRLTNNKFWKLYYSDRSAEFGNWTDIGDSTISGNELGTFSGGYDSTNKLIRGTWSGVALTG